MEHIMKDLFNEFEKENIKYIHFKSNTNLDKSFLGKADFDILVEKKRLAEIENILISKQAKRCIPVKRQIYPGVDNWLLFDAHTGIVYHLHLYYQLVTGKRFLKDYIIPWNNLMFNTRIKDAQWEIFVINPNLELILLMNRCVVKATLIDYIKAVLNLYKPHISIEKERVLLLKKVVSEDMDFFLNEIYSAKESQKMKFIILKEKINGADFLWLNKIVRRHLKMNRRSSGVKAWLQSTFFYITDIKNKIDSRYFNQCVVIKKTIPAGGKIIAFVGVDGSGKSTISDIISNWLEYNMECKRFYMGTGDGKLNFIAGIIKKIGMINSRNSKKQSKENLFLKEKKISIKTFIQKIMAICMIVSVEKDNFYKLSKMNRYRLNGGISILDRFPQIEIYGQNDGLKVEEYERVIGENWFTKKMKKREKYYMDIVKLVKPDLIFRLNISAETSMKRKPEQTCIESFRAKIQEISQINFQNATIIEVDAEDTFDNEILEIKRIIWKHL